MKKKAFTLAEVLITVGIIGVVAALVLPQLRTSTWNDINSSRLASTVQSIEAGFTNALVAESRQELSETTLNDVTYNNLSRYMVLAANVGTQTYQIYELSDNGTKGDAITGNPLSSAILLKSGAIFSINKPETDSPITDADAATRGITMKSKFANVYIDINGSAGPNIIGRDVFRFVMDNNGILFPYGSLNQMKYDDDKNTGWDTANSTAECTNSKKADSGWGCTARLVENNYKRDY